MIHQKYEIGCIFQVEKFKADGTITYKGEPFENTVLDNGLLKLYDYSLLTMGTYLNIGQGSTPPEITQTGLINRLYSTNNKFVGDSSSCYNKNTGKLEIAKWCGVIRVFQFNIGTCTGDFTELGLSRLSDSDYFNRQLFKDKDGNNIVVRVAADEGLRITCDLRVYPGANINPYAQIFKLNTFGATSGTITFSVNSARTINITELVAEDPHAAILKFNQLYTNVSYNFNSLCGNVTDGFYLTVPMNRAYGQPLPLTTPTITGNTLVGNSSPPTIEVYQAYDLDALFPNKTTSFNDVTAATTENITYKQYGYIANHSDDYYCAWSAPYADRWFGHLAKYPFKDITAIITSSITSVRFDDVGAPTVTTLSTPSIGNYSLSKKIYWAPGGISTSTYNVQFFALGVNPGIFAKVSLTTPIQVLNTQDFEFAITMTWGRKA